MVYFAALVGRRGAGIAAGLFAELVLQGGLMNRPRVREQRMADVRGGRSRKR